MSLPYTIVLSSDKDLLSLESGIRELLRCQGTACAFLQCAEYKRLKFAITRALRGLPPYPPPTDGAAAPITQLHIPASQLVMYITDDCSTVVIQTKPPRIAVLLPEEAAEPSPAKAGRKRKKPDEEAIQRKADAFEAALASRHISFRQGSA